MPESHQTQRNFNLRFFPHGIMLGLVLCVIFLSVMAFMNPVAQDTSPTPSPFSTASATDGEVDVTQPAEGTGTEEILPPPTPEEIGSTNGIIIWSTVLILILIIATLRETLLRKGEQLLRLFRRRI